MTESESISRIANINRARAEIFKAIEICLVEYDITTVEIFVVLLDLAESLVNDEIKKEFEE